MADGAAEEMARGCGTWSPLETGGLLIGYHDRSGWPVISNVIGPGPDAVHALDRFVPDYRHQEEELGLRYERSGRRHGYLGDWHSHPGGAAEPSSADVRVLRRIACAPAARLTEPLMAIAVPSVSTSCAIAVWQYVPRRWGRWLGGRTHPLRLSRFVLPHGASG